MSEPMVSIITPFFNTPPQFIQEAIESVLAQTYSNWELLLIDDGSTNASTDVAMRTASKHAGQVCNLEHPGHANRGMCASRNLGLRQSNGEYIAFLDADDIWLPHKLEQQVELLNQHSKVGMLYGRDQYWYSWAQEVHDRDFLPKLGLHPGTAIDPPCLLALFLRGKAAIPCPTGILLRRSVIEIVGEFEETFTGMYDVYEDQAFYAKVCLKVPVLPIDACWDKYRQHDRASCAVVRARGQEYATRQFFLNWLAAHLESTGITDAEIWQAIRKEVWLMRRPKWFPLSSRGQNTLRWTKKWILRLEEAIVPARLNRWLWSRQPSHLFNATNVL